MRRAALVATMICVALVGPVAGQNLVENGDFESGTSGFTSDYLLSARCEAEGTYAVGEDPAAVHYRWESMTDYSASGTHMLMVNSSPEPNQRIWAQTIAVQAETAYEFSFWLGEPFLDEGQAQIAVFVDGLQVGVPVQPVRSLGVWTLSAVVIESGQRTSIDCALINLNTETGGNDVVVDDIRLIGQGPVGTSNSSWTTLKRRF